MIKVRLINLTDLGFELNSQENIGHAYFIGHGSNFFINSKNQIASLFGLYNLQLSYQINQEQFQNKTEELLENIEKPAQNATLFLIQRLMIFTPTFKSRNYNRQRTTNKEYR